MHDPLCVAFTIHRPWPKRLTSGRRYWPTIVTVWHREPQGHDTGAICKQYRSVQQPDGISTAKLLNGWRFHVHHWKIQIHALQKGRRRLLTRCAWCAGRDQKRDPISTSLQWDGSRGPWWRGERSLYHSDCASIASAHGQCVCVDPICGETSAEFGPYGKCARCGSVRSFGVAPEHMVVRRELAAVPVGQRRPAVAR